ncbi:MAG: YbhB/YbcL family Raf kinase inhibitor-like protein [Candidatus Sulfotelmatobacter sp.]|jgi:Raf kinase inhibitor-like YbhB/YbcL family protein
MKKYVVCLTLALASLSTALAQQGSRSDQQASANSDWQHQFQLSSTTFTNGGQLPLSMVLGSNNCTYVSGGGDQSPELSWTHAPFGTKSFVVTVFDVTASFTHWGMYNISPKTTELPENAGVSGSTYGKQVFNDFFLGAEYDGPCPPNNYTPLVHDYVFTVYALDTNLSLQSSPPNFPADAETLYRAMFDHVLQSASIQGYFSSAN